MGSSHLTPLPMARQNTRSVIEEEAGGQRGPQGGMRLGLHVEQRGNLNQLVRSLKLRLDAASSDLQVSTPPPSPSPFHHS
jgi:hypothetical protein